MFAYYTRLAVRSFRRNKILTALMVVAIALGIGASMTTLTVFHVLSGDPIPGKSDQLFYVQVDPRPRGGYTPGEEPEEQMTRRDAETLLREKLFDRLDLWVHPIVLGVGKKVFDGGAVPTNLTLLEPPAAGPRGTVYLRYGLAGGTPGTGDMSAPDRGVRRDG